MQYSTTCALTSVKVQFHEWKSKRGTQKGLFCGTAFWIPLKPPGSVGTRLPFNGQSDFRQEVHP